MRELLDRVLLLFFECLWIVVAPMTILVIGVISFELFIFHPEDMERLLLIEGVPAVPQEALIKLKSGELPRRIVYLGSSLIYIVTFAMGCLFYFYVVRSGLCRSHTQNSPLRSPGRSSNSIDVKTSNVAYFGIVGLSIVFFFSIVLLAEDINFIHHEIHQHLFSIALYTSDTGTDRYFDPAFVEALGFLTPVHYLMGFISGSLTLLAFAATAVRPANSINIDAYWQSQVRRLHYVSFAGSFIILTGVILMGSRFQWTSEIVGGALELGGGPLKKKDIAAYPTVVVAYWAVIMSVMLLVTYLTVVWRLLANGVRLSLSKEIRSATALFAPIAGSVITAIL